MPWKVFVSLCCQLMLCTQWQNTAFKNGQVSCEYLKLSQEDVCISFF